MVYNISKDLYTSILYIYKIFKIIPYKLSKYKTYYNQINKLTDTNVLTILAIFS